MSFPEYHHFPEADVKMAGSLTPVGYFIFLIGSFTVGASATILQVVLNPYLSACEVKGTQPVQRLAIGGSSNSVGTTIAPYFVTGVVFGGAAMSDVRVEQITIPFLSLMAVAMVLFLVIRSLTLPDIEGTRAEEGEKLEDSVWSFRHLTLGVIAIFFYVCAEVCIGANINMYAIEMEFYSPALLATLYWGRILVGRVVGSSLSKVSPKVQLVVTTSTATVLILLAIILNNLWLLAAVGIFHSIMWGAIFTLSVNKLGKYTKCSFRSIHDRCDRRCCLPSSSRTDCRLEWRMETLMADGDCMRTIYVVLRPLGIKSSQDGRIDILCEP